MSHFVWRTYQQGRAIRVTKLHIQLRLAVDTVVIIWEEQCAFDGTGGESPNGTRPKDDKRSAPHNDETRHAADRVAGQRHRSGNSAGT